jgi:hypothetical protein
VLFSPYRCQGDARLEAAIKGESFEDAIEAVWDILDM